MPLPLCSVLCRVQLQEGGPDVGAIVIAKLNSFEVYDGYVVPQVTQGTTDENGEVTLDLFPNELGSVESAYDVTITSRTGKKLRVTAVVPNNTDANMHEIAVLPPFPGKVDGQLALEAVLQVGEEANQAAIDAQNASSDAQSAAINAASSQAAAQGSETAASNSASSASASASTATTQAGIATAQAGIATTQAGIATAQVASIDLPTIARTTGDQSVSGVKTFNSSPVIPAATQDGQAVQRGQVVLRTGGALTGHLETVAGASGNQVPRASEVLRLAAGGEVASTLRAYKNTASPGAALSAATQTINLGTAARNLLAIDPLNASITLTLAGGQDGDWCLLSINRVSGAITWSGVDWATPGGLPPTIPNGYTHVLLVRLQAVIFGFQVGEPT